jgi:molybdate-binding protein
LNSAGVPKTVYVRGYIRSDGKYVQSYYRAPPSRSYYLESPTEKDRANLRESPGVAENGTYYGQLSDTTGRPKTVYVNGYYRKDGTYVRSHYRSSPRR